MIPLLAVLAGVAVAAFLYPILVAPRLLRHDVSARLLDRMVEEWEREDIPVDRGNGWGGW